MENNDYKKRQQLTNVDRQSLMVVVMKKVKEKNPNVVAKLAGDLLAGSSRPSHQLPACASTPTKKKKINGPDPLWGLLTNPAILLPCR